MFRDLPKELVIAVERVLGPDDDLKLDPNDVVDTLNELFPDGELVSSPTWIPNFIPVQKTAFYKSSLFRQN